MARWVAHAPLDGPGGARDVGAAWLGARREQAPDHAGRLYRRRQPAHTGHHIQRSDPQALQGS